MLLLTRNPPVHNFCSAKNTGKSILGLEVLNISRGAYSQTLLEEGKFR